MKLPESNHIIWVIVLIGVLVVSDSLTSWLLYQQGYEVGKDLSKTMILVTTVLVPVLLHRWKASGDSKVNPDV